MRFSFTKRNTCILFSALMLLIIGSGCKKLVTVDSPVSYPDAKEVYANDASATAVLTGIYSRLSSASDNSFLTGIFGISVLTGFSSDEFTAYTSSSSFDQQLYQNALTSKSSTLPWSSCYSIIYTANAALTGIGGSTTLSTPVAKQLDGEARFIRALSYFTLVNLYGDVPLLLTTDFMKNSIAARAPKAAVWQQIISDLKDAQSSLSDNFIGLDLSTITTERTRPTKWAATALLARVYLYTGNYPDAAIQSAAVIENTELFNLEDLSSVFLMNNNEAIWQLQPVMADYNTEDARVFVLKSTPGSDQAGSLSPQLLNAFESGDLRKASWIDSITVSTVTYYFPFKYKIATSGNPLTEYENVLRLAEQYLIRAEALAQTGDISGAQADLNKIRTRAGLPNTTAADQASLLAAILQERQVELFSEGHRWFDLKRTGNITTVMNIVTPLKGGGPWNDNYQLYPIPFTDLTADHNLIQNQGY